jgi:hypothetical protein
MYPGTLDEHPIPDTSAKLSKSTSARSIPLKNEFITIPFPHPGQKMLGSLSVLKYFIKRF